MYSIGMVQRKTGLSGRQIRYYEQSGLIEVKRSEGNQRRFSEQDIARLMQIKTLINRGLDVADIKEILDKSEAQPDAGKELVIGGKLIGENLTSLYPVSNRAELVSLLSNLEIKKPKR